jgi:hypothetical protein
VTDRRQALKRGLTLMAYAAGIGAASEVASARASGPISESPPSPSTLILRGRHWRITSQDLKRGQLPTEGARMMARGELVDGSKSGRKIGHFFATYYRLSNPGKVPISEPGSLELHTFVLAEGTILGSGTANAAIDSEGHFAIIGGTGRYQGVKGSYTARQSYRELGGDGKATFTLTLL